MRPAQRLEMPTGAELKAMAATPEKISKYKVLGVAGKGAMVIWASAGLAASDMAAAKYIP